MSSTTTTATTTTTNKVVLFSLLWLTCIVTWFNPIMSMMNDPNDFKNRQLNTALSMSGNVKVQHVVRIYCFSGFGFIYIHLYIIFRWFWFGYISWFELICQSLVLVTYIFH